MRESGIEVDAPAESSAPLDTQESLFIVIDTANEIRIDGRSVDQGALQANVVRWFSQRAGHSVLVQAHKKSRNNTLVTVLDTVRLAEASNIAPVPTQSPNSPDLI